MADNNIMHHMLSSDRGVGVCIAQLSHVIEYEKGIFGYVYVGTPYLAMSEMCHFVIME